MTPCACPRASLTVSLPSVHDALPLWPVDRPFTDITRATMVRCHEHGRWLEFTDPNDKETETT